MTGPRWWQERTGVQRLTFLWSSVAVVAVLAREMQRQRHPYVPDWRHVGVTAAGDTLELDLSSVNGTRETFAVRLTPADTEPPELLVTVDCARRAVTHGRVQRRALGLTPAAVTLACDDGH